MKQKLALSCALIHKPSILFLDEPTTGVDPVSRKEFWGMLKKLKQQGITILVSTPYMDEASLCDRVAFIQQGGILTIDTPQQIIENFPRKLYKAESEDNYLLLNELRNDSAVRSAYIFGDSLHVTFHDDLFCHELHELARINSPFSFPLRSGQGDVIHSQLKEIVPGIEDCFIDFLNQ
jgi:ABC-type multidrug transport system ATPase subunit